MMNVLTVKSGSLRQEVLPPSAAIGGFLHAQQTRKLEAGLLEFEPCNPASRKFVIPA